MLFGPAVALAWAIAINTLALVIGHAPARAEIATWYSFESGSRTSNGERFNPDGFCADYPQHSCTCAHRSAPFGTQLRVSRAGRSVVCRVNDRGPHVSTGAHVDLSLSGARVLGMVGAGRARVRIEKLERME